MFCRLFFLLFIVFSIISLFLCFQPPASLSFGKHRVSLHYLGRSKGPPRRFANNTGHKLGPKYNHLFFPIAFFNPMLGPCVSLGVRVSTPRSHTRGGLRCPTASDRVLPFLIGASMSERRGRSGWLLLNRMIN